MIADCTDLTVLSDVELDRLIIGLIKIPIEERTPQTELFGQSASGEWQRRYPATVSPSFLEYAMERGGFPSCYSGARVTIDLEEVVTEDQGDLRNEE